MIVLLGFKFEKGYCETEDKKSKDIGSGIKEKLTQKECGDYCNKIPDSTGCQHSSAQCVAYKVPIHVKKYTGNRGYHCLIFEKRNKDAREKIGQHGRITKTYKINLSHLFNPLHCCVTKLNSSSSSSKI